LPAPELVIFGAGHDAVSMVNLAQELGWQTTVVDCRSSFQVPRRLFHRADRYFVADPAQLPAQIPLNRDSLVILMTHHFEHDRALLRQILPHHPKYVGILGPKVRAVKLLAELGAPLQAEALHYPMGLDIGGDTPHAVALSALAEIQAVLSGRRAGFLRDRSGPIHGT
jgi:xanthine/CO dehydrogenase XdhC/CoxF family maturation factor